MDRKSYLNVIVVFSMIHIGGTKAAQVPWDKVCSNGMLYAEIKPGNSYTLASRVCLQNKFNMTSLPGMQGDAISKLLRECSVTLVDGPHWLFSPQAPAVCNVMDYRAGTIKLENIPCQNTAYGVCSKYYGQPPTTATTTIKTTTRKPTTTTPKPTTTTQKSTTTTRKPTTTTKRSTTTTRKPTTTTKRSTTTTQRSTTTARQPTTTTKRSTTTTIKPTTTTRGTTPTTQRPTTTTQIPTTTTRKSTTTTRRQTTTTERQMTTIRIPTSTIQRTTTETSRPTTTTGTTAISTLKSTATTPILSITSPKPTLTIPGLTTTTSLMPVSTMRPLLLENVWHEFSANTEVMLVSTNADHGTCLALCLNLGWYTHVLAPPATEMERRWITSHVNGTVWVQGNTSHDPFCALFPSLQCPQCGQVIDTACYVNGFQCLCQRPTNHTVQCRNEDGISYYGNRSVVFAAETAPWATSLSYCHQYRILAQPRTFLSCVTSCAALGPNAGVAVFTSPRLNWDILGEVAGVGNLTLWTEYLGGGAALTWPRLELGHPGSLTHPCLCQQNIPPSLMTPRVGTWIQIENRQYLVNPNRMTYNLAEMFCRQYLGAHLLLQTSPMQYLRLARDLQLEEGTYWVDGGGVFVPYESQSVALLVGKGGTGSGSSLRLVNSQGQYRSLCSRIANISAVLSDPLFVRLISDLTVDTHKTGQAVRRLMSADDDRPSARTVGGGSGALLVGIFLGLVLLLDAPCIGRKRQ